MNEFYTFLNTFHSGNFAYIDPGTGSFLFQMLVAGALSTVMMFKNLRNWIFSKFAAIFGRTHNSQGESTFSPPPAVESSPETSPKRL